MISSSSTYQFCFITKTFMCSSDASFLSIFVNTGATSVDGQRNRRRRLRLRYGPFLQRMHPHACGDNRRSICRRIRRRETRKPHPRCARQMLLSYICGRRNVSRLVTKQTYQAPTWRDASYDIPTAHAYVQLRAHRYRLRAAERHKYVWDMNAWACTGRSKSPS